MSSLPEDRDEGPVDLLLVHPHGHLLSDWYVPVGALTTCNSVRGSRLGVYSWELTDGQIRAARVVALDWYWHFSLPAVRAVAARVRRLNPAAPIVVGGLTASWFGRRTFEILPADFVAIGDAEAGFDRLVEMGPGARRFEVPPNFLRSNGAAGTPVLLGPEELDRLDPVSSDWFPSLAPDRAASFVLLVRGCAAPCGRTCLASEVSGPPLRVHSPGWVSSVVRRAREKLGPGEPVRLLNVGARDESVLIGSLDGLAGDPTAGPLVIWTYGLSREFLDYVLDRCPDATIGLVSPWETLGWPHRQVSDLETTSLLEPIEHLVGRLRSGGRGSLVLHLPGPFRRHYPQVVERVRGERTTLKPSDSFYVWTPESPPARDLDTAETVRLVEEMGDLGARILLLERLVPGLLELYPMRSDPHPEPAEDPPLRELHAFHRLVLRGWSRWRMQVPEPFDFEVHLVKTGELLPAARAGSSLPSLAAPHRVLGGATVSTGEKGVALDWEMPLEPLDAGSFDALVVLPRGLSEYVASQPAEVLFLPVPLPGDRSALRLSLRVDPLGIAWQLA